MVAFQALAFILFEAFKPRMKTRIQPTTMFRTASLACLALLSALALYGGPVVIVDDLTDTTAGVDGGLTAAGQSFTVGATPETLQDIVLDLLGNAGAVDISLFSNNGGLPGSSLLSLGTLTPSGSGYADYTAEGTYALAANTTYWVVVDYLGAPSWGYTDSSAFTGTGAMNAFTNSMDGGTTWRGSFDPTEDFEPYQLEVDATTAAAPEPSSFVWMLMGIGAMLVVVKKLNRARQ